MIPFLLRGVNLLGIDSVLSPLPERLRAWQRIALELPMEKLAAMVTEVGLAEVPAVGAAILRGEVQGRIVVDVRR